MRSEVGRVLFAGFTGANAVASAWCWTARESGFATSIIADAEQQHELDRGDDARDQRRGAPRADQLVW